MSLSHQGSVWSHADAGLPWLLIHASRLRTLAETGYSISVLTLRIQHLGFCITRNVEVNLPQPLSRPFPER